MNKKNSALIGAAFLMATSAIGPGFLTQTTVFTEQLLTSFGFVILLSILLDIVAQTSIWRVLTVSNLRAQDLANQFFPYLGHFLAFLIAFGGLAFNIGNIAGAGLGLESLLDIHPVYGGVITAVLSIALFMARDFGKMLDLFVRMMGVIMIILIIMVCYKSGPPYAAALYGTFIPEVFDAKATITLVGGTVGGYITFAGAHRLIDAGMVGREKLGDVTRSAFSGILITGLIRYLLFLACLGVTLAGGVLLESNPTSSVFEFPFGELGKRFFGMMMWAAAITSVIGSAFTSVSFLKSLFPFFEKNERVLIALFILVSLAIYLAFGKPVKLLVFAGYVNGFILPIGLAIVLLAAGKLKSSINYEHPLLLTIGGWLVVGIMSMLALKSLAEIF